MKANCYGLFYLTNYSDTTATPSNAADNSTISSVDIYKIPSGNYYNIPSGSKYWVPPVNPGYSSDSMRSDPSTNPSMVTTRLPKLGDSKICQHIWSFIFNGKKYLKDLKRYDVNDNHWHKVKDKWSDDIYASQLNFILKTSYILPDKLDPYACNTSDLKYGYIFKILDLNIPTSNSHQFRNALERF